MIIRSKIDNSSVDIDNIDSVVQSKRFVRKI